MKEHDEFDIKFERNLLKDLRKKVQTKLSRNEIAVIDGVIDCLEKCQEREKLFEQLSETLFLILKTGIEKKFMEHNRDEHGWSDPDDD